MGDTQRVELGAARPGRALVEALSPLDAETARLLSALSHEMRTPLTSVLGYVEMLTDESLGPVTAEQGRVLRTVADAMARLTVFIDDLEPRGRAGRG